ncbi:MAG: cytochrome c, partial [Candidatus Desantisbacteria bacterium]
LLQYLRDKAGPLAKKTPAVSSQEAQPSVAQNIPDGKPLYDKYCAMCHGANGNQLPMASLGSPDYLKQKGTAGLIKATNEGKGGMPPFGKEKGGQLDAIETQAIIAYLEREAKVEGSQEVQPATKSLPDGKPLYDKYCAMCHGAYGNQLPMAALGSGDYLKQTGAGALIKATAEGKGGMPAFGKEKGGQMDMLEIQAVIAYLEKGAK